jgi:hypothetical protein
MEGIEANREKSEGREAQFCGELPPLVDSDNPANCSKGSVGIPRRCKTRLLLVACVNKLAPLVGGGAVFVHSRSQGLPFHVPDLCCRLAPTWPCATARPYLRNEIKQLTTVKTFLRKPTIA